MSIVILSSFPKLSQASLLAKRNGQIAVSPSGKCLFPLHQRGFSTRSRKKIAQIWFFFGKPLNIYGNAHRSETRVSMPLPIIYTYICVYIVAWCNRIPRHRVFPTTRRILEASLNPILYIFYICIYIYIYRQEIKQIAVTSFGDFERISVGRRST